MSISRAIATRTNNKFVVPCAGKMFRSNVTDKNKALCFVLNKGYIQTDTLEEMKKFKSGIKEKYETIFSVGNIDKVILAKSGKIVYRQRFFFKNFKIMLDACKYYGLTFEICEKFEITINNVINCNEDLKYLEFYAKKFNETITEYLTNTCLIYVKDFLRVNDVYNNIHMDIDKFLEGKRSYLERAPFLIVSYSIDKKESGIFILDKNFKDNRKFDVEKNHTVDFVDYGFTENNVQKDLKNRVFTV